MKNLDSDTEELFIVVSKMFAGRPPRVHKSLSDRFHLTPEEAWEVATRENELAGGPFWTVVCFSGRLVAELESVKDVKEW